MMDFIQALLAVFGGNVRKFKRKSTEKASTRLIYCQLKSLKEKAKNHICG